MLKDVAVRVSPARGMRGVRVTRSAFSFPTTSILGSLMWGGWEVEDIVGGAFGGAFGGG